MLYLGTCSWKYDSWKGLVYSELVGKDYLSEYSERYNTVEIDQWFWSLFPPNFAKMPDRKTVQEYVDSVPDEFRFSVKIPNSITLTHFYQKSKKESLIENPYFLSEKLMEQFLESLTPMKHHLGPLMFQFEYLNKQKMSGISEFVEKLESFFDKTDKNFQYGIEIRNPNYLNRPFFEFLNKNNLTYVFLQGYYMPSIFEVHNKYNSYIKGNAIIRLHGPDRKGIEKKSSGDWSKIYESKDEEIAMLSEMLQELFEKETDVYVNVNNHYEGSAPLTIEKIEKVLGKE